MSYAVIKTGGKQYRVTPGMNLTIEKLDGEIGEQISFDNVLLRSDGSRIEVGTPLVEGATVTAKILRQGRGPRILVYKKKRRKNYRLHQGHRQWETTVEVTAV